MKKNHRRLIAIIAIFLALTSTALSAEFQPTSIPKQENELAVIDSLSIIQVPEGKYYVFCNICPLSASNGFLQLKILDTLDFIDNNIPQRDWVRSYVTKNYCYNSVQKRSLATFENGYFVIKNRFDDYHAIRGDRKISSFMFRDIQKNSEQNSLFAGTLASMLLLLVSIIVGIVIFFVKAFWKKALIFLTFPLFLSAFLVIFIIATKPVMIYAISIYLTGSTLMPIVLSITKRIRRKKGKK